MKKYIILYGITAYYIIIAGSEDGRDNRYRAKG